MRRLIPLCILFLVIINAAASTQGSVVRVRITGTTRDIHISEGPVFGHRSQRPIVDGTAFTLTYIFDDTKGENTFETEDHGDIKQSGLRVERTPSPGTGAVLEIGDGVWDFGESVDSEIHLKIVPGAKSYSIRFITADKDNWICSKVFPEKGSAWPTTGDWRQSFDASALQDSASSFSIDNGTVSATGNLIASKISVSGVNMRGQALSFTTITGGPHSTKWVRQWHLTRPSPRGGCVIESVTKTVVGTTPPNETPISPFRTNYWIAWRVPPGTKITIPATESFEAPYPRGSTGTVTFAATARFYEGMPIPSGFAVGTVPSLGAYITSIIEPSLTTNRATLPLTVTATLSF